MKHALPLASVLAALGSALVAAAVPIRYELPSAARVSIHVLDGEGRIVRELLHAEPRAAGAQVAEWDGLDENGAPLPPGRYAWKLLATPGFRATYLMSLGTNYPVDPEDWRNRAPGTHGGPTAVAVDDGGIYVAASCTENIENYLLKMDHAGTTRLWSVRQHVAWTGGIAMASDGGRLYVLSSSHDIWVYNATDGQRLATFRPRRGDEGPADLAARDGRLAVCFPAAGEVAWLDSADGAELASVPVPRPAAVALAPEGAIVALSGHRLCRIGPPSPANPGTAGPVAVLAEGLVEPQRVDVDSRSGEILVAEGGASQHVKRFSPAGALRKVFGRAGGRRDGLYEPRDFRGVTDIAADGRGGFLVAEPFEAPRRVAWLSRNGRVENEWYGGQAWAPWAVVEPDRPHAVWMQSAWGSMMRLVVDLRKKRFRVHSTYRYDTLADGLHTGHHNAAVWEMRARGKDLYLVRGGESVLRIDRRRWRLVPATILHRHVQHYRNELPPRIPELADGGNVLQWNDRNGDGLPQPEEIAVDAADAPWSGLPYVADNFGVFFAADASICETPVSSWTDCGAPVYGDVIRPSLRVPSGSHPRITAIEGRWGSYFQRDPADGSLYAAINDRMPDWGRSSDSFLAKFDASGETLWTVGRLGDDPGRIWRPFRRFVGLAHGCPVLTGFSYEYPADGTAATYVWDADGLWAGELFDTIDLDAAPENLYTFGAEALHAVLVEEDSGDILLYGCWLNETRVFRITGWKGWKRMSGTVDLEAAGETPAPSAPAPESPANAGLLARYYASATPSDDTLALERVDTDIDFHWGVYEPGRSPMPEKMPGHYSVRWSGFVTAPEDGLYAFRSDGTSATGVIRVGGRDFRSPAFDREHRANYRVWLEAGEPAPLEIAYDLGNTHPATDHGIRLQWLPPRSHRWRKIPVPALSH
jgi:hypothetical protein